MKEIVTWSLSVKIAGSWRNSPEYASPEQATSMIVPFLNKFQQKYTSVTIVRNVRLVPKETAQ